MALIGVAALSANAYRFGFLARRLSLNLSLGLGLIGICGQNQADSRLNNLENLPVLAAEFTSGCEGQPALSWRFWREAQRITIETPVLKRGEVWQRDGAVILHRQFYHLEQRAIEFHPDDLNLLQANWSWGKLALLVDQKLLDQLTASPIDSHAGYPSQTFTGLVNGQDWRVVIRSDWQLPIEISQQQADCQFQTKLLQLYPLAQAPWQPIATEAYPLLDFADLGDKESDPFVAKLLGELGHHQ